jgi:uncharacterized protein (DUF2141 family)
MPRYLLLTLISIIILLGMSTSSVGRLEIDIDDLQHDYGTLWIGVYASEAAFLDKDQAQLLAVDVRNLKSQKVFIDNLPYGDYAIALFHDLNSNGEMDISWLGIPQEPFAFSRPVPSKWRLPKFSEVKVGLYQSQRTVRASLASWWDFH